MVTTRFASLEKQGLQASVGEMEKQVVPCFADSCGRKEESPKLFYCSGPGQSQMVEFNGHPYLVIGRSERADIVLRDPHVSRRHAGIGFFQNRFTLVDLGSTNGTFRNGVRIDDCYLQDGDLIQVGETILAFQQKGEREAILGQPPLVASLPQTTPSPVSTTQTLPSDCSGHASPPCAERPARRPDSHVSGSVPERLQQRIETCKKITAAYEPTGLKAARLVSIAAHRSASPCADSAHKRRGWFPT